MFNLMLNDIGKAAGQRFVSEKIGIIDIGFRTADYTISEKTRYSERGSQSSDAGIAAAYQALANVLTAKCGVRVELYRLYAEIGTETVRERVCQYVLN